VVDFEEIRGARVEGCRKFTWKVETNRYEEGRWENVVEEVTANYCEVGESGVVFWDLLDDPPFAVVVRVMYADRVELVGESA
jgi:predicted RNA-binding protein